MVKDIRLDHLKAGSVKSCGCMQATIVHGDYGTRLYSCWRNMKSRSASRKDCKVYPEWDSYEPFKDWAIENGYDDSLELCRNGDVGNYEPGNCRWDTHRNNMEECFDSDRYLLISPEGMPHYVTNMAKHCREYSLSPECMFAVLSGNRDNHRGWHATREF
jgi:hypothetical protein